MGHKSQEEPFDLMASGLGGSGLSTEIKEPLLANYRSFSDQLIISNKAQDY